MAHMYRNQFKPTTQELANMVRATRRLREALTTSAQRPASKTTGSKVTNEKTMR